MDIDEKIPHMGWNQLHITNHQPILKYVQENDDAYFVHSYMAHCKDENLVAYTDYGTTKVTALVQNKNVIFVLFLIFLIVSKFLAKPSLAPSKSTTCK